MKKTKQLLFVALSVAILLCSLVWEFRSFLLVLFDDNVCEVIDSIHARERFFRIILKRRLSKTSCEIIPTRLSFEATIYGQKFVMPENTSIYVSSNDNLLVVKFPLPFVTNYTGFVSCKGCRKRWPVTFQVREFDNSMNSQIKCFNDESFLRRFCRMKNIGYINEHLIFYTKAQYTFPYNFLSLSGRAPPFDREETRHTSIIVTDKNLTRDEVSMVHYSGLTYVFGRFYNSMMLWHTIYDCLVPLYRTIQIVEGITNVAKSDRKLLIWDDEYDSFMDMYSAFTTQPVRQMPRNQNVYFMEDAVVGLYKLEKQIHADTEQDNMIRFQYSLTKDSAVGFRELILSHFNVQKTTIDNKKPLIVLQNRENNLRTITNFQSVINRVRDTCSFCDVVSLDFGNLRFDKQLELASRTSVMIGLHGSGLAHVAWMEESRTPAYTMLLEILPYGYGCRNWYESAATMSRVNYAAIMNRQRPDVSNITDKATRIDLNNCLNHPELCSDISCHNVLRDQSFDVEMDVFNEAWQKVLNKLIENQKV